MKKYNIMPAKHGLKYNIWFYFVFLIIFIAILMWLFQIMFFNQFYLKFKEREIRNIGHALVSEYEAENFHGNIYRKTNYDSMPVRIFNRDGVANLASSLLQLSNPDPIDIILFSEPYGETYTNEIFKVVDNPSISGSQYMVYGIFLKEGETESKDIYIYIFSQLASMDNTASVLKEQLVLITMISLIFAIILSLLISFRLAKPISKLTDTAGQLATGNYDINFEGGVYAEIDKLANSLNYATNELSKTDRLRRELISNVSHELRTPLTLIKSYAEMIRDLSGSNPEKREQHIGVIINESNRMTDLVNDILDLSKYESGTSQLELSHVNITHLTKNVVRTFSDTYYNDGYIFTLDCDENLEATVDNRKFHQILYNLISNAVNYAGDDKKVNISVKKTNDKIRFEIADSGDGIPSDQEEKIWDRFYSANEYKSRPASGTGLGLSIVKSILKLHDAAYGVINNPGSGCTFWFELQP